MILHLTQPVEPLISFTTHSMNNRIVLPIDPKVPALEIVNLEKVYDNSIHALKGISMKIAQGDFFALLGPNGAGKSTAISIICTLVRKNAGSVRIFGLDVDRHPYQSKRMMGVVPQEFNFGIFERSIDIIRAQAGYYGLAPSQAKQNTEKYMKLLNLWEFRNEQARHFSGGMKRRLMIARALVHQPKLLVLDEPSAGVDVEMRLSMWEFLRKINNEGITIILTTHYLEEAESLCRNIAIIDHGEIIQYSSMAELLKLFKDQTFVLDLSEPLKEAPLVKNYSVNLMDPHHLEVEVRQGQEVLGVFQQLKNQNIEVTSLRNKHNRLEQLFIRLTGSVDKEAS